MARTGRPRSAARDHDDSVAYTVPCGTCGAPRHEPCIVLIPHPRGPLTPPAPILGKDASFFARMNIYRQRVGEKGAKCDHAHTSRVKDARLWALWHHGIAPGVQEVAAP